MKVRKVKTFYTYFVFSKAQIVFWSRKGMGLSALLMLIFSRFDLEPAIYCNFFRFEFCLFIDSDLW